MADSNEGSCSRFWSRYRITCLRGLVLVSVCFSGATSSAALAVYVYINALKAIFQLSQTQASVSNAMSLLGFSCGFVPGFITKRLPAKLTLLCGAVLAGVAYILLYDAVQRKQFYIASPGLIIFYHFLMGLGNSFLCYVPLSLCYQSFTVQNRGKVMGLTIAAASLGKVVYSAAWGAFFADDQAGAPQNHDLAGYFLMTAIILLVAVAFGMVFMNVYPPVSSLHEYQVIPGADEYEVIPGGADGAEEARVTPATAQEGSFPPVLKRLQFHALFWQVGLAVGVEQFVLNDMAVYLTSFHYEDYIVPLTIMFPIVQCGVKLLSGFFSDVLLNRCNIERLWFFTVTLVLQVVFISLCIFFADNGIFFVCMIVIMAAAFGLSFTLSSTMFSQHLSPDNYVIAFSLCNLLSSLLVFGLEVVFGTLYGREIVEPGQTTCYGLSCFVWSFVIVTCISLVALLLNLYLQICNWRSRGQVKR